MNQEAAAVLLIKNILSLLCQTAVSVFLLYCCLHLYIGSLQFSETAPPWVAMPQL